MTAPADRTTDLLDRRPDRLTRAAGVSCGPIYEATMAPLRTRSAATRRDRYRRICTELRDLRRVHEGLLGELRLAEQVQRSLLPRNLPRLPGVSFGAGLRPADHLAGDFYNVFRLDRDHVGFYLGDVVGHGPAAALMGIFIMQSIRPKRIEGNSYEILSPSRVLEELNRVVLAAEFPNDAFFTMVYGVLDTARLTWSYCCGGHPPPLLLRRGERPRLLEVTAPVLGVMDASFEQAEETLRPSDRLVVYSDGVGHAHWGGRGPGLDALIGWLDDHHGHAAQRLIDEAIRSAAFIGHSTDDLALLIAHLDGAAA